jgi:protein-disulfide isomerase
MASRLKPAVNSEDHIQGNKNASLELVEYGDYQCPHCGRAYPIIKAVQEAMGNNLKFVFRNFPLSDAHPDAFNAALAAEAAGLQHRFWEMHDIIYENQELLDTENLLLYAKAIGLDLAHFELDIQKESVTAKVEEDFESGIRSGVNGTPSFFINGEKYEGSWDAYELIEYLTSQLA